MHPLDQLEDEIAALRVATTVDPQDEDRIYALVDDVESAYPTSELPDSWDTFTSQLEDVLNGVRDSETTRTLYEQFKTARNDLPN